MNYKKLTEERKKELLELYKEKYKIKGEKHKKSEIVDKLESFGDKPSRWWRALRFHKRIQVDNACYNNGLPLRYYLVEDLSKHISLMKYFTIRIKKEIEEKRKFVSNLLN